ALLQGLGEDLVGVLPEPRGGSRGAAVRQGRAHLPVGALGGGDLRDRAAGDDVGGRERREDPVDRRGGDAGGGQQPPGLLGRQGRQAEGDRLVDLLPGGVAAGVGGEVLTGGERIEAQRGAGPSPQRVADHRDREPPVGGR